MASTRRDFLKSTTKTAIGTGMFLGAIDNSFTSLFGKNPVSPPNILFIFADQMRNRSWYHYDSFIHTPNLNRLASEGMTFDNCISTSPLCSPFRAMLLTGRYPRAQGILHNDIPLPDTETTIAQILKARGYRTGYVGKWHLSGGRSEDPTRQWIPAEMRFGFEDYWKAIEVQHAYRISSPKPYYYDENNTRVSLNMYQTTGEADLVIDFILDHKQNHSESPFFMCWSPSPPHSPYDQYPTSQTCYSQDGSNRFTDIPWLENVPLNNQTQSRMNAIGGYYSLISQIDRDVGSVLDELDKPEYASIKENTIVVFTSDHGDMLYSQGKTKKLQPWEESINVPFIIRYPDVIQPNQTTDALMGTIDIMPTLLGLANLTRLSLQTSTVRICHLS